MRAVARAAPSIPVAAHEPLPVNVQARWIVGIATGVSLMAAVWVSKAEAGGVVPYAIYASLNALPLLSRGMKEFITACRIAAVLIILLGLLGVAFGLFYFWPAAGLLLLASHAADGYGRLPRLMMTIGVLVGVLATAGWGAAIYQTALRPAHAYLVTFESVTQAESAAGQSLFGPNIGFGASAVSRKERAWDVSFPATLSPSQRSQLAQRLRQLPGVVRVGLCSRWKGEC